MSFPLRLSDAGPTFRFFCATHGVLHNDGCDGCRDTCNDCGLVNCECIVPCQPGCDCEEHMRSDISMEAQR